MGRPTKFTAGIQQEICNVLAVGGSETDAAIFCGIKPRTLINWKKRHPDFFMAVARALVGCKLWHLKNVRQAAENGGNSWRQRPQMVQCPACSGSGSIRSGKKKSTCPHCGGVKKIAVETSKPYSGDWRASSWLLAVKWPDEFSEHRKVDVGGDLLDKLREAAQEQNEGGEK